jgi:hypothetical protein
MSDPIKAVCRDCAGRGYVSDSVWLVNRTAWRQCAECESRGWVWAEPWTPDHADTQREWIAAHMPHQLEDGDNG